MLLYRGHRYAEVERTAEIAVPSGQKPLRAGPEFEAMKAQWKPLTDKVLSQYGIKPSSELVFVKDTPGVDVIYDIAQVFKSPATIRFDINENKKSIQEVQASLKCAPPHAFVASAPGDVKALMLALKAVQAAVKKPGSFDVLDADAVPEQLKDYTENVIMFLTNAGVDIDFTNREAVIDAIAESEINETEKENAVDVLNRWDNDAYIGFITLIQAETGSAVGGKQAINDKVAELTKHEGFVATPENIIIQAYTRTGSVVLALKVPWATVMTLERSGSKLVLKDYAQTLCNIVMSSGPNEALMKALLSAQVDLIIAGDRAANPAFDKPDAGVARWTKTQLDEFISTGIGLLKHPVDPAGKRRYDLTSLVDKNKVVASTELGPKDYIERNARLLVDRLRLLIDQYKPMYHYVYDMNSNTCTILLAGKKTKVATFNNVQHEFDISNLNIINDRQQQDLYSNEDGAPTKAKPNPPKTRRRKPAP
jgi:hypothetical protein